MCGNRLDYSVSGLIQKEDAPRRTVSCKDTAPGVQNAQNGIGGTCPALAPGERTVIAGFVPPTKAVRSGHTHPLPTPAPSSPYCFVYEDVSQDGNQAGTVDFGGAAPRPCTCRSGRGHRKSKAFRKQSLTLFESRQCGEPQMVTRAGASSTVPFSTKAGAVGLSVLERPQGSCQGATDEARAPASPSERDTVSRPLSGSERIVPPSQCRQEARQHLVHAMSCPPYLGHIALHRSNSRDTRANRVSPGGAFAKFRDVLVEARTIRP